MKTKPPSFRETARLFAGGVGVGIMSFGLLGGLWGVTWPVLAVVALVCGVTAVLWRQNSQAMLSAVLDTMPGI